MLDRCPQCGTQHLIFDSRLGGARCTKPGCNFKELLSRAEYTLRYADRSRMVVLPQELGGGINPEWRGFVRRIR